MKMSIGICAQGPIFQCLEWAKIVEGYGFDTLGYTDDMMFKPGWPIANLASQHTSQIELGVMISNPHTTHPAILAMNAAMLDEMSNGRAFLGIGRGDLPRLRGILNVVPAKPLQALREAIEFSKRLWCGDTTPYRGKVFFGSEEAHLLWDPGPARANIPVMVGAWGPKAVTMAGALAERVQSFGVWNPVYANMLQECIANGAREAGRDPSECELEMEPVVSIKKDGEEAKALVLNELAMFIPMLSPLDEYAIEDKELLGRIKEATRQQDVETAKSLISDDILDKFALYGTPTQVIDKIEAMVDATGVKRISFAMPFEPEDVIERIHQLGKNVVPHFLAKR